MKEKYKIKLMIITGLSGAGKSEALKYFEDSGYYCIDNLPAQLILSLIDSFSDSIKKIDKIALAIDLRSGYFFDEIYKTLEKIKELGVNYKILFLEASKSVLIKRFSLTRRKHPLVEDGNLDLGIEKEIEKMHNLREISDLIIDTTLLSPKELRITITDNLMSETEKKSQIQISILSFGYKYGIPQNVDIIMDVRFLPNPFYDENLKDLSGEDKEVLHYVLNREETKEFLMIFEKLLDFLIPNYIEEGKSYLGIGIGCTGGRHRSVVISERIYEYLKVRRYSVKLLHRDISKS
ncbi:MAG: RNase adapter RapZ [Actinobacteria bacterium]|nr:RNase adapter RapZ [Actinomycetota bacterium]